MEKINLPPFYVGQKVVAIKNYDVIINGKSYIIKSIIRITCGCYAVDVGVIRFPITLTCSCRTHGNKVSGSDWFDVMLFVPIEQTFIAISCEKVIEIEQPLISAN